MKQDPVTIPPAPFIDGTLSARNSANRTLTIPLRFRPGCVEIFQLPAYALQCYKCGSFDELKSSGVGEAFCRACHAEYRQPEDDDEVLPLYTNPWPTVTMECQCRPADTDCTRTNVNLRVRVMLDGRGRIDLSCERCSSQQSRSLPLPCHAPIDIRTPKLPTKKNPAFTTQPPAPGDAIYVYDQATCTAREATRILAVIRRVQELDIDLDIWTVAAVRSGVHGIPAVLDVHKGKVAEPKTIVRGDKTIIVHGDRKAWFPASCYPAPNVSPKIAR